MKTLIALLMLTTAGCATTGSVQLHVSDKCETKLFCLKEDGDRCAELKLELKGSCTIETAGVNLSQ